MGILGTIIKTTKDLYQANSNNQLGEYVGNKVSGIVNRLDGTEKKNLQQERDGIIELIQSKLSGRNFDNDDFQKLMNKFLDSYAQTDNDAILYYYYKACGWNNVLKAIEEAREEDSYWQLPEHILEEDEEREQEANRQCLENLNGAIGLLEEDATDWVCTLFCSKAERLHWMGEHVEAGYHVEAVRLAIQGLPYACDEDDKEWAKSLISGKGDKDVWLRTYGGYGIYNPAIKDPVGWLEEKNAWYAYEDVSLEENEKSMELSGEKFPRMIQGFLTGQRMFKNRPYHDRQFIFTVRDLDHIGGCYDETDNIRYVFPLDELPSDISFPVGHPQANTLYYAHPLRPMYLPFENAQLLLFYEKVQEMCRLFQCLGATSITARCLKGNKVSKDVVASYNVDMAGGYKMMNASGGHGGRNAMSENRENKDEMFLTQTFSPKKAPYCPDDLVWAKEDPELQTFIRQRLDGGLLEFTKKVSSYDVSNISQNQINDVKAAFEGLMANVSTNYSAELDGTFSHTSETEWEISVQFQPLDEFEDYVSPKELNAKADARKGALIMEILKFFYMEGRGIVVLGTLQEDVKVGERVIISGKDSEFDSTIEGIVMFLKMLDEGEAGDRAGLCLSGVTALNIQVGSKIYKMRDTTIPVEKEEKEEAASMLEQLTPEEEKYREEVLFCLEDNGVIMDDDRRYLERKRRKLGITEKRADEIERQAVPCLTDDEKEYLETFRELSAEGTMTDRIRRLLEREREALNISKERAEEIEKMLNI